jgi:hypothetical protein
MVRPSIPVPAIPRRRRNTIAPSSRPSIATRRRCKYRPGEAAITMRTMPHRDMPTMEEEEDLTNIAIPMSFPPFKEEEDTGDPSIRNKPITAAVATNVPRLLRGDPRRPFRGLP